MYMAMPTCTVGANDTGLLYLTDVFGVQLAENRLLADSFARQGFITVAPDMFQGQPAPSDINDPTFNSTAFIAAHDVGVTDPIIANTINFMRTSLGVRKLAVVGYCFGGRYSFRFVGPSTPMGARADVAFAAHPSLWQNAEVMSIGAPVSVAAAEDDNLMPPATRSMLESLLGNTSLPYQLNLYSGVAHGFGVRANVSDVQGKFAKEQAFLQAVNFFSTF